MRELNIAHWRVMTRLGGGRQCKKQTNDWSGKGGESHRQQERQQLHDSVRQATTIEGGGEQCNN
jgi:hypothetical protein